MKQLNGRVHYTSPQIFIIGLLVTVSMLLAVSDNPFTWEITDTFCIFGYIERGEYTLEIYCEPAARENYISVRSDAAIGENGIAGMEFAHISLDPGEGGYLQYRFP